MGKLDQSESNKRLEETRGGKQWHQQQQSTGSKTDVDEYNKWRDFKRDEAQKAREERKAAQKEANRIRKEEIDQRNAAKAKAAEDERREIREAAARAKAAKEADEKK